MPAIVEQYLGYLLVTLGVLIALFAVGCLLLSICKIRLQSGSLLLFGSLLIGLTLFAVIAAVWATKGTTVLIGMLLPLLGAMWHYHKNKECSVTDHSEAASARKNFSGTVRLFSFLGETLLVAIALFTINFFLIYTGGNYFSGNALHEDNTFYAYLSQFLWETGRESYYPEFLNPSKVPLAPYHYFELWLNAGLSHLVKTIPLLTLLLIVQTIGLTAIWLGYYAVAEKLGRVSAATKMILLLCLFITGFNLLADWGGLVAEGANGILAKNVFTRPKLFPIYLFLVTGLIAFLYGRPFQAFSALLCLPIVNIITAPGVLAALLIYNTYDWFAGRRTKEVQVMLTLIVATGFFLLLFYGVLFRYPNEYLLPGEQLSSVVLNLSYLWLSIKISVLTMLQTLLFYLPAVLLAIFAYRPIFRAVQHYQFASVVPLLYGSALAGRALLEYTIEAWQIFSNLVNPLLNISIFAGLYWVWQQNQKSVIRRASIMCLLLFAGIGFWNTFSRKPARRYSDGFIRITAQLLENKQPLGGFILNTHQAVVANQHATMPEVGLHLFTLRSDYRQVAIFLPNHIVKEGLYHLTAQRVLKNVHPFLEYVSEQRRIKKFRHEGQSQVDFIRQHRITHLFLAPGAALSPYLHARVDTLIEDPYSREQFVLLKPADR